MLPDHPSPGTADQGADPARSHGTSDASPRAARGAGDALEAVSQELDFAALKFL